MAAEDNKKIPVMHEPGTSLTISSSAMLASLDTVLQDGLTGDLEHHLPYGALLCRTIS